MWQHLYSFQVQTYSLCFWSVGTCTDDVFIELHDKYKGLHYKDMLDVWVECESWQLYLLLPVTGVERGVSSSVYVSEKTEGRPRRATWSSIIFHFSLVCIFCFVYLVSVRLFSRFAVEFRKFYTFFIYIFHFWPRLAVVVTFSQAEGSTVKRAKTTEYGRGGRGMRAHTASIRHCFSGLTKEMWRGMERSSAPGWKFCSDTALSALLAVI